MKFFKNKINIIISLLLIIAVVLMLFSSQRFTKSSIEGVAGDALNPIQKFVYSISNTISDTYKGIIKYSELIKENEEIKKQNGELRYKALEYEKLKDENERLRSVINFKDELNDYDFLGANVIGKSGGPHIDDFIIDVGENDSLKIGMVVIANNGLFGMITSVSKNWSIVSPIISGNITVSGVSQRTRGNVGIVRGYTKNPNDNMLVMEQLPIDEDIIEGDVIVTSGLGGVYPSDIQIGQVESVVVDNRKMSKSVLIKPYFDFKSIGELFIILPKDMRDIKY